MIIWISKKALNNEISLSLAQLSLFNLAINCNFSGFVSFFQIFDIFVIFTIHPEYNGFIKDNIKKRFTINPDVDLFKYLKKLFT